MGQRVWVVAALLALTVSCGQPDAPRAPSGAARDTEAADAAADQVAETHAAGADAADDAAAAEELPDPDAPAVEPPPHPVPAYGVSAGHPAAVEAGMAVLEAGGNAVDAAIATAYAVGVAEPFGSGVGGGGAALIAEQGADPVAYDYRDVVNNSGTIPASEVGIPGFVAGMEALHADYGSVPLADLIAPAVELAENGVAAYPMLSDQLRFAARRLPQDELPHFYPGGQALAAGERLVQSELASTLRALADGGAESFYDGALGVELAARVDGIDAGSLSAYEVKVREPVAGTFAGRTVVSAPPPLAGATLVQMLQVAEGLGVTEHAPGSSDFVHALALGWRLANHYRSVEMADPDFVDVVTAHLTDGERNAALAAAVPADRLPNVAGLIEDVGGETTHLVVVDADGTVVSMTNTLTAIWGSGAYELGFFLNDQLSNFGLRRANEPPEPGKRAVSSTVPSIVFDDEGRPVLGLGSPGGSRIPLAIAQVLVRWAAHGEPIADAVAAPRFHLAGTKLHAEEELLAAAAPLRERGYSEISGPPFSYYFGSVQALEIDYDAGVLHGAADPRRAAAWRAAAR